MVKNLCLLLLTVILLSFSILTSAQSNECVGATVIPTSSGSCTPTLITLLSNTYTASPEPKSSCSYSKNKDAWFKFVATSSAHIIKMFDAEMNDPNVYSYSLSGAIYSGTCGSLSELGCGRSETRTIGGQTVPKDFIFSARGLTVGEAYYLRINSDASTNFSGSWYWADTISFNICIQDAPTYDNDECIGALPLSNGMRYISNYHATRSMPSMASCSGFPTGTSGKDLWFSFTSTITGMVNIELDQSDIDIVAQAFSGACGALTSVGCVDLTDTLKIAATAGQPYFVRVYGYNTYDTGVFGIRLIGDDAMTVNLLEFDVVNVEDENIVKWRTSLEEGLSEYVVQYSSDILAFSDIGRVFSNNNSGLVQYNFIHKYFANGNNYYRLKILHNDGTFEFSNTKRIENFSNTLIGKVYPNPTQDKIFVAIDPNKMREMSLYLINSTGHILALWEDIRNPEIEISMMNYPAGLYVLQSVYRNTTESVKIAKE